ncbi:MAG: ATP-binding cassette domain-containing protein [Acidimicrobiales bacterium]
MPRRTEGSPLVWLGGLIALYLGFPLAAFLVRFVVAPTRGFHEPGLFASLWVSVNCATVSLALITLFGVPLAYFLARSTHRIASVIGLIVQIPLALPPIMSGIILVYLVGPYTFLGRTFHQHLTNSLTGVVLAMTFCSAPFLIIAARSSFVDVDQSLLDVAATLGHSSTSRFLRVAVPLAGPGIRAGMVMTWLRAFGEYGAVVILAYNPASLPIYTYNQFSGQGLPTTLAPTFLALAVAVVVVSISRLKIPRVTKVPTIANAPAPVRVASRPVAFKLDHHIGTFHLALEHRSDATHLGVLGPSGSGKSALIRCLTGLYGPGAGPVWYGDQLVHDIAVERRRVGYVAQRFTLYPHLTMWRHLLFAKGATPELAAYWTSHLHLDGLEDRLPSQLSGGQRQRVGLAQVLCGSPEVLLLDEPFSAVDMPVRLELRRELRRLQRETGLATVLVTHDPEEAAFLSDELMVIGDGRTLQSGASRDVFARPASPEVARLLGIPNLRRGRIVSPNQIAASGVRIAITPTDLPLGTPVLWNIRPEAISLVPDHGRDQSTTSNLRGVISDVADVGTTVDVFIDLSAELELKARVWEPTGLHVGERYLLDLPADAVSFWNEATSRNSTIVNAPTD